LLLFGGGERVHLGAPRGSVVAKRLLDQTVHVRVRMHWVVVEERQLLHTRLLRQRQGLLVRRVPETGVRLVLVGAVLRVMHEQVRVAAPVGEAFQRSIGTVGEQ